MVTAKSAATRGDPRTRIENPGSPPTFRYRFTYSLDFKDRRHERQTLFFMEAGRRCQGAGPTTLQNFVRLVAFGLGNPIGQRLDLGDERIGLRQRGSGEALIQLQ